MPYRDRREAGRALAKRLSSYARRTDTVVLGLPRGGVPVAAEVARLLRAPLDVFVVRELGRPDRAEPALGAIATGEVCVLEEGLIRAARVGAAELAEIVERETEELRRRELAFRGEHPAQVLRGRTVLLIDEGLAGGSGLRAALPAVARHRPAQVVVGAPVGEAEACARLAREVHELVCPLRPEPYYATGCWYDHFAETSDEEVRVCMEEAREPAGAG